MLFLLAILPAFGQATWVASQRTGDEARFLVGSQILRYDLSTKSWLTARDLPRAGATAMAGDEQGTAVAYGTAIYRSGTDFSGESLVGNTTTSIESLFFDGNLLIAVHSQGTTGKITVFDRTSGIQLSTISRSGSPIFAASLAPNTNRIYGLGAIGSAAGVMTASYTDVGVVGNPARGTQNTTTTIATKTWVFPEEARMADTSGIVNSTPALAAFNSFSGSIADLAFNGDVPVVLRGGEVIAFTSNLQEAGRGAVGVTTGAKLYLTANDAFVFSPAVGNPAVNIIPLSSIHAPVPGTPIDPAGLAFTIDRAFPDKDGNLLLFSKAQMSLFRWSPSARQYTGSIPLDGIPTLAAYSKENHSAYFAYDTKAVQKMDLSLALPEQTAFVTLPGTPNALEAAGDMLFTADLSVTSGVHSVFSGAGVKSSGRSGSYSQTWQWDPAKRRMYHYRSNLSPDDLAYTTIDAAGQLSPRTESPYHAQFAVTAPIRVSPDGSKVVIGSGVVFETEGLTKTAFLANSFSDAVWAGGKLVTIRALNGGTQLQTWEGNQFLPGAGVRQLGGTPVGLFETPEGIVVVTSVESAPRFTLLDAAFNTVFASPARPVPPSSLAVAGRTSNSVTLRWQDLSDSEDGFRIEYRAGLGTWLAGPSVGAGMTSAVVSNLTAGTTYEFRAAATNGPLTSTKTSVVTAKTVSSPDVPIGEPYNLRVSRAFHDRIVLEWQDNADNETAFNIYRSLVPSDPGTLLTAPASSVSFTDTGLEPNTLYYYRIQAVNGAVLGDLSAQVNRRTLTAAAVPSAPSSLTAVALGSQSVVLAWNDTSPNEDEFIVERSGSPASVWTELGRVGINVKTFTDGTVTPDVTYSYRVKSSNATGISTSSVVTVKPPKTGGDFAGYSIRSGDIYYFAFKSPDRIERYNLQLRSWLAPVPLQAAATGIWVDEAGIYVAEGRSVVRIGLDGGNRTPLANSENSVRSLFTIGDILAFQPSSTFFTLDKQIGTPLATFVNGPHVPDGTGFSVSTAQRKAYYRPSSQGSSEICSVEIGVDGKLINGITAGYRSDYQSGSRTYLFPDGARVADDSGTTYDSATLTYTGNLGGRFTDLSFHGTNVPIILRDNKLLSYDDSLLETGLFSLDANGLRVAVSGIDAVVFFVDGAAVNGLRVQAVPLSEIKAQVPGPAVNPRGLAYTPDDVLVDKDGTILLFSKSQMSLFRWAPSQLGYLPTLPLIGAPAFIGYAEGNHHAYFAYDNQVVREMDLATANPVERPLFNLPTQPRGFTLAGEIPYVADGRRLMTFSKTGAMITPDYQTYSYGNLNTWEPVNRRVYHFRDNTSPNDLHYDTISEVGVITGSGETPYHAEFTVQKPIRVRPDGSKIVIGSGVVFNASDLTKAASLANGFTDATWFGGQLVSARLNNGVTQIQTWIEPQYVAGTVVREAAGTPLRMLALDSTRLLLISMIAGEPQFTIFNEALEPVFVSQTRPTAPSSLTVTDRSDSSVSLSWQDLSGNEDGFRVEYRTLAGDWTSGVSAAANATAATVTGLPAGTSLEFRVIATLADLTSTPSPTVNTSTLSDPNQPIGEPYGLKITRVFDQSITLEWQDNANNETGFRILQSTSASGPAVELNVPAGTTSFDSTGLTAATSYFFRVQAMNGTVAGDVSAQVSATTFAANSGPAAPSNLNYNSITATSVALTWKDNSANEETFEIERADFLSPTWTTVGTVPYNSVAFTDSTLSPYQSYSFRVKAVNANGSSVSNTIYLGTPKIGGNFTGRSMRSGDIYYFVFNTPDRIERYDLVSRTWLPSITLEKEATALWVDESGIFVAEDRAISRFSLDGSSKTPLANGEATVGTLYTLNQLLGYAPSSGDLININKQTGAFVSTLSDWRYNLYGFAYSVIPSLNRALFLRGGSPMDICYADIGAGGNLIGAADSPYHADYTVGTRTYLFPDQTRIADDSGTVYSTANLNYSSSFGSPFTDMSFRGSNGAILLRSDKLQSCNNALLETGSFDLGSAGLRVAVSGEDAVVFFEDYGNGRGLRVQAVPLSSIVPATPDPALDPRGLAYTPDDSFVDKNGSLLLFSKERRSLFRWSPVQKDYLPTIPLSGAPAYAAYHKENHRVYFAYDSQVVRKIELNDAAPIETPFVNLPGPPKGLVLAGEFPVVASAPALTIYTPAGQIASNDATLYYNGHHFGWDSTTRRMYHFSPGSSSNGLPFDTINSAGTITGEGQVSYYTNLIGTKPIRVSPDASKIAVGSGLVFNASGLTEPVYLANTFTDGVWFGGNLVTIRLNGGLSQLQVWKGNQFLQEEILRQFPGTPVRLHALDSTRLVLISIVNGEPCFTMLNESLEPTYVSPTNPAAPSALAVTQRGTNSVSLRWQDNSNNEDQFIIEYRTASSDWTAGGIALANATEATVSSLAINTPYEIRVSSKFGTLTSAPSSTVSTLTLSSPDQPVGEPYGLKVTRVFSKSITIGWQDNTDHETGFRIFQSATPDGTATEVMLPAGSTSYTSSNLAVASTYYFRVQVVNGAISGDLSAQVGATTRASDAAPATPYQLTVAGVTATSVTLSWSDFSYNEETFRVERSTNLAVSWMEVGNLPYDTATFTDGNVLPNTAYSYRVKAVNSTGSSGYSQVTTLTPGIGGVFTGHSMRSGNTYYFAFSGPNRIERYDLAARNWLTPIPLNSTASALWADESYLFVAEDRTVVRFSPDGGNRTLIANASGTITRLFTLNDVLVFLDPSGLFTTLAKHTGSFLSSFTHYGYGDAFTVAPSLNRAFCRKNNSNVAFMEIGADGNLLNQSKNWQTGANTAGSRLFVFPNDGRVADTSGNVYSTDSVSSTNTLGAAFTDLAFHGIDIPIVLRGDKLVAYDNRLMETGSFTLAASGLRVAVSAADAVVFTADALTSRGLKVDVVPLSSLSAAEPGAEIDPRGLTFTPNDLFLDRDGNLLLFSKSHLSVFRWSSLSGKFLSTLPLVGSPKFAAFSKGKHRAYFSYESGVVREMDLTRTSPAEASLVTLPESPLALAVSDEFITTTHQDPSFFNQSVHSIYTSAGVKTVSKQLTEVEPLWEWEPIKRRMYYLKNSEYYGRNLFYETIDAQGMVSGSGQTADNVVSAAGMRVRANLTGTHVVIGSGAVIETTGMMRVTTLPNPFTDAMWRSNELLTIRAVGNQTEIQRWDAATFSLIPSTHLFDGTPLRLIALDPLRSVLITMAGGKPVFHLLNADLTQAAYLAENPPPLTEDMPFTWIPDFWQIAGPLTVTAPVVPAWLTVSNGVLSGTPLETDSGDQLNRSADHRIVLRAANPQGVSEQREFTLTALWQNDAPKLAMDVAPLVANSLAESTLFDLKTILVDPDRHDTHLWQLVGNSNPSIFSKVAVQSGANLGIAYAPQMSGESLLTIQVTDASGASAQTNLKVILPGLPAPSIKDKSPISYDRKTGKYTQEITVTNTASRSIAGFDLKISGIRKDATLITGTMIKKGQGRFTYSKPMAAGKSVRIILKYKSKSGGKFPRPDITATLRFPTTKPISPSGVAIVPLPQLPFAVTRIERQLDGGVSLTFNADPGRTYRVQYSDDAVEWKTCPDEIHAETTSVSWLDSGPPGTDSSPASRPSRFYRILRIDP